MTTILFVIAMVCNGIAITAPGLNTDLCDNPAYTVRYNQHATIVAEVNSGWNFEALAGAEFIVWTLWGEGDYYLRDMVKTDATQADIDAMTSVYGFTFYRDNHNGTYTMLHFRFAGTENPMQHKVYVPVIGTRLPPHN